MKCEPQVVEWPLWWGLLLETPKALAPLVLLALLLCALALPENRNRAARTILWATACSCALGLVMATAELGFYLASVAAIAALTTAGLRAERASQRPRSSRVGRTIGMFGLVSILTVLALGLEGLLCPAICALALTGTVVARWRVRGRLTARAFAFWAMAVNIFLGAAAGAVPHTLLLMGRGRPVDWIVGVAMIAGGALALFALEAPFFILAFVSPFYRERFEALLSPEVKGAVDSEEERDDAEGEVSP